MRHLSGFPKAFFAVVLCVFSITSFAADDVTTATNGLTPSGKRYTLAFEENLRIGPDKGDNFLWTMVGTTVQADDQGFMYVCDPKEKRITVIDAEGGFVRFIGGPGQGPGEFQALASFQILADGRGLAFEALGPMSALSWYDKELKFVEKAKLGDMSRFYNSALFSGNGQLFFSQTINLDQAAGKMIMGWIVRNRETEEETKLVDFDNPMPGPQIMESPEKFSNFMGAMMKSPAQGLVGFAAFDADNNFYTATAKHYVITRWDSNMKKQLVISRKYKPIAQTEEEIKATIEPITEVLRANLPPQMSHMVSKSSIARAVEIADFPPVKHPVNGLSVLADGTLLVVHNASLVTKDMTVDMFDKEGHYLGNFSQSAPGANSFALVFKKGQQYRIESNSDDENVLVRYSYKMVPAKN